MPVWAPTSITVMWQLDEDVPAKLVVEGPGGPKMIDVPADHIAEARIEGDEVVVRCDKVRRPVAVRYAFTNFPVTNLENGAGWPVVPFRTDDWNEKK